MRVTFIHKGGPGSGNFGHAGRPGLVGGSAPSGMQGDYSNWDFSNYYQHVEMVPVSFLDKIAEFDRAAHPLTSDIKDLAYSIQREGIKDPLIIDYSADDGSVSLAEGNHRLAAAKLLGLSHLPARVVVRRWGSVVRPSGVNLLKLEPDDYGYVPSMTTPGSIGINSIPVPKKN